MPLRLFGRKGGDGADGNARRQEPPVGPLPIYLSGCVDSRDAICELVRKYSPHDGRFSAYGSEARALCIIRDKLLECAAIKEGRGAPLPCTPFDHIDSPVALQCMATANLARVHRAQAPLAISERASTTSAAPRAAPRRCSPKKIPGVQVVKSGL